MTSTTDINHSFLTHNPKQRKVTVQEFGTDYERHRARVKKAERQSGSTNLDAAAVWMKLETVKSTHASYFGRRSLDELLPA